MKNFRIVFFVTLASLFASCDDAIDIKQPSELTPEQTFETVDDLQLGLNGVYSQVPGENHIYFTSLFTDEVKIGKSNGGQGKDGELAFLLNTNSGDAASIWVSNYGLINAANRLIAGAQSIVPTEDESEEYNNILAQAHVLRAFGHFQLLSYFSPNMADDSSLGVPALDFVPTTKQQLPRNTTGEVFALIESDLAFADANLSADLENTLYTGKTGVTSNMINAFRARMYVYREKYDIAEPYADAVTGSIATFSQYPSVFKDTGTSSEVIWQLSRVSTTGNFAQYWSSVNSTVTGSPFFEVSTALFNLINDSRDIRRDVIVDPSAAPSYTVRPVGKYSASGGIKLRGNIKVFRVSEIKFLKAEIFASRGDYANVVAEINKVLRVRFNPTNSGNITLPANADAVWAWTTILRERRKELAFEGHRYVDLRRLGAKAGGVSVDRTVSDFAFNQAFELPIDDHRWTLPIPRAESAANPDIQQNPGY